jgi:hypothetical protein
LETIAMTHPDSRPSTDRRAFPAYWEAIAEAARLRTEAALHAFDVAPDHLAGAVDVWELAEVAQPVRRLYGVNYDRAYRFMLDDAAMAVQSFGMVITIADRTGRELSWQCLDTRSWYRIIITPAGMAPCPECKWRGAPIGQELCQHCLDALELRNARRYFVDVWTARQSEAMEPGAIADAESVFTAAEAIADAESDELMVAHGAGYVAELAAMLWGDQGAIASGRLDVKYHGATWIVGSTFRPAAPHIVWRVDIDASPAACRWLVTLRNDAGAVESFHADGITIGEAIADARRRLASRGFTEV